jgi:hypothetical protein
MGVKLSRIRKNFDEPGKEGSVQTTKKPRGNGRKTGGESALPKDIKFRENPKGVSPALKAIPRGFYRVSAMILARCS